jgi:hypothetical protein
MGADTDQGLSLTEAQLEQIAMNSAESLFEGAYCRRADRFNLYNNIYVHGLELTTQQRMLFMGYMDNGFNQVEKRITDKGIRDRTDIKIESDALATLRKVPIRFSQPPNYPEPAPGDYSLDLSFFVRMSDQGQEILGPRT